jgi:hypothetical protein
MATILPVVSLAYGIDQKTIIIMYESIGKIIELSEICAFLGYYAAS